MVLLKSSSEVNSDRRLLSRYCAVGVRLISRWAARNSTTEVRPMLVGFSCRNKHRHSSRMRDRNFRHFFSFLRPDDYSKRAKYSPMDLESVDLSSYCLGRSPISASTLMLEQDLFSTAKSMGVYPLESVQLTGMPSLAYSASTSGMSLQAAQWMSGFLSGQTLPDQLDGSPPWMAHWSTFPLSTAPLSLSISMQSLLQQSPATSMGVWPSLLFRLRIGSLAGMVLRKRGMQGELWEHM